MFVYAIYNKERNKIYIGCTVDINKRLQHHNGLLKNKKSSFTSKNKGVWEVAYKEVVDDRNAAVKRERKLKSAAGRKFIRSLIH